MHDDHVNPERQQAVQTSTPVNSHGPGRLGQVTPDFKYAIYLGSDVNGDKLADIFVVASGSSITIEKEVFRGAQGTGTEYWFYSNASDTIGKLDTETLTSIFMDVTQLEGSYPNYDLSDSNHTMRESGSDKGRWGDRKTYTGGSTFGVTSNFFAMGDYVLELVVGTEKTTGTKFLHGIQWYQPSTSVTNETIGGAKLGGSWQRKTSFDPKQYIASTSM